MRWPLITFFQCILLVEVYTNFFSWTMHGQILGWSCAHDFLQPNHALSTFNWRRLWQVETQLAFNLPATSTFSRPQF